MMAGLGVVLWFAALSRAGQAPPAQRANLPGELPAEPEGMPAAPVARRVNDGPHVRLGAITGR
jgi:hypothetical protein